MNYIQRFQNEQVLSVSVKKSYSGYQLMHIFLDNFYQGGKYTAQIASLQAELRREQTFTDQNIYLLHFYRLNVLILTEDQVLEK